MQTPNGLFQLTVKKGRTHHLVKCVHGFYTEDGYCVVARLTDRGLSECYYEAHEVVAGHLKEFRV